MPAFAFDSNGLTVTKNKKAEVGCLGFSEIKKKEF
jgi:hypothetical protein